jgi:hypothetical protein
MTDRTQCRWLLSVAYHRNVNASLVFGNSYWGMKIRSWDLAYPFNKSLNASLHAFAASTRRPDRSAIWPLASGHFQQTLLFKLTNDLPSYARLEMMT